MLSVSCIIYLMAQRKKNTDTAHDSSGEISDGSDKATPKNWGTKNLCVQILRQFNCEVEFDSELDYRIYFRFQGESFFIDASNESCIIEIWDTWWMVVALDDIDEMARVRKALNTINISSSSTLVFTIDKEENNFVVHTKKTCLLIKEIPHLSNYLQATLESFFQVKRALYAELDRLKKEEEQLKI